MCRGGREFHNMLVFDYHGTLMSPERRSGSKLTKLKLDTDGI